MHLPVASRVQLAALKVPVPSLVQLTVPVGMFAPLPLVTVAVQAVELSTATEGGAQLTLVAVARRPTASSKLPVLVACRSEERRVGKECRAWWSRHLGDSGR